ncbi:MAG: Acetyl-CoA decarbonylase/synthase complex subunit delta 1 [Methanomassiliicoccales archaeon PtaU1.Bin124]|nr:MAG: Acetyl-CoA decarbonylase/synthase complex subunit delta 1 [Methanomassiliicoccales archaeon PtaU1.Bin124]
MVEVPLPKDKWSGKVNAVNLGAEPSTGGTRSAIVTVGGENAMPFLGYEGLAPNRVRIAGEVTDMPGEVPEQVRALFGEATSDVAEWAKVWVENFKADLICLRLASTNPEESNVSPQDAALTVLKVLKAVSVPIIVYGCGQEEKDAKTMEAVSNAAPKERLLLGQAEEGVYKSIAAAGMANNHAIVAFSNLDINLAKQITILLTDFGVRKESIVMDPLMAPLGMGLEYSYSVNERIRLAALAGDGMLQLPMLCDCTGAWKCREATDDVADWGDRNERGKWWEATTALAAILSGADILIMRHPGAAAEAKRAIEGLRGGA